MASLTLSVLLAGIGLTILIGVMVITTYRADRYVDVKGRLATTDELDSRIATKREVLVDMDSDLQKRRDALAHIAETQADLDALLRRNDEAKTEWEQMAERREEVLAMRRETEEAQANYFQVQTALASAREDLERVETQAAEARAFEAKHAALADAVRAEQDRLDTLRRETEAAQADRAKVQDLKTEAEALQRDLQRLEARLAPMQADIAREQDTLNSLRQEVASARVDANAVADMEARSERLSSEIARMEARREVLGREIEVATAQAAGAHGTGQAKAMDPLEELQAVPMALTVLRNHPERMLEAEAQALHRVANHLSAQGLTYPRRVLRAFHTAMKVNETTQLAVLAGISGTGKSQLPRRYAEAMGIGFLQVPVQPRWDSPQDLLGFYNYIEGRYRPTDMVQALWHMDGYNGPKTSRDLQDRMLLILLDEMNLSRVEYYFSDFLSRLESRPAFHDDREGAKRKDAELQLDMPVAIGQNPPRIFPGYNLLFAGTMNEDESTQSLSDKVVDRANFLRFTAPAHISAQTTTGHTETFEALSWRTWRGWVRQAAQFEDSTRVAESVSNMADLMKALNRPFGHRLGRAVQAYVANYPQDGQSIDVRPALADQVEMRLLPKLRGVEVDSGQAGLEDLERFVRENLADDVLADAIRDSVAFAQAGTGQFVWRGVTRA